MADPTKFVPGFDYSDFEQSNPTLPKPGAQLDNDFANVKQTTDQTIDALKQIRRSDGALKNGIVTADSLSPGLIIGIETPQAWQTATTYSPPDTVFVSSGANQGIYRATIEHVSTTFAADLAAGKWELIFNLTAAGLSAVALSGEYVDLLNKPVLGTAAATDADDYATAAQGTLADSAVQPEELADVAFSGVYADLTGKPFTVPAGGVTGQTLTKTSNVDGAYAWQNPPGGGDMLASIYDPQGIEADAFDRGNHTGEQDIDTITGLQDALDERIRVDAAQSLTVAQKAQAAANVGVAIRGYISPGFNLINNAADPTNDIDFPAGTVASEQSPSLLMEHTAAPGMRLDIAWGVGNGGRFDASISDGWWHCFVISNGTLVSRGFSTSLNPTAQPNYPAGFTHYKRVGTIARLSGAILRFWQKENHFDLLTPITARNSTAAYGANFLSIPVPPGIVTEPKFKMQQQQNAAGNVQTAVGSANENLNVVMVTTLSQEVSNYVSVAGGIFTDTSSQIAFACDIYSGSLLANSLIITGWIDQRGRS